MAIACEVAFVKAIRGCSVPSWPNYIAMAFLFALLVRAFLSLLKAYKLHCDEKNIGCKIIAKNPQKAPLCRKIWKSLKGCVLGIRNRRWKHIRIHLCVCFKRCIEKCLNGLYRWWRVFLGFDLKSQPDYLYTLVIGVIELISYPIILFATNEIAIIGGWISLKALAQWRAWSDDRSTFNRFLIGNALVVILSIWLMVPLLDRK